MKTVLYEKDGLIGRVTLNRPEKLNAINDDMPRDCLLYTSPSPRDRQKSRMPSSA